jgi:hypothetical protein
MVKFKEHSQILRDIVLKHYNNGKKAIQISDFLAGQVTKRTIYRWISEFKSKGI